MSLPDTIQLRAPVDMHLHLRDGDMLTLVAPASASSLAGAVIMPNLVPPITTAAMLRGYRERILTACGPHATSFRPLMTFFLQPGLEKEIDAAGPDLFAVKFYPHGVTTNSESGLHSLDSAAPLLSYMQEAGVPLLVHGETSGFVMDREEEFLPLYTTLAQRYPRLRIVMEHITTAAAVALLDQHENLHATVTAHHLIITLDDVAGGLLRPHLFCKPIAKRPEDRQALLSAALRAHPKLMLGSDSAPHPLSAKEACGCAAGVWTAPVLLPRLAQLFAAHHALPQLQAFVSDNARRIHQLTLPEKTITLRREDWTVPTAWRAPGLEVIPWEAGETLAWQQL